MSCYWAVIAACWLVAVHDRHKKGSSVEDRAAYRS